MWEGEGRVGSDHGGPSRRQRPPKGDLFWLASAFFVRGALASVTSAPSPIPSPGTCEFKTINYLTHTLPQQCLRTSWAESRQAQAKNSLVSDETTVTATATPVASSKGEIKEGAARDLDGIMQKDEGARSAASGGPGKQTDVGLDKEGRVKKAGGGKEDDSQEQDDDQDLATGSFMSFEEWKEMMLRKSGQDPADVRARKQHHQNERQPKDQQIGGENLDSIGDEGEISLDFEVLSEKVSELTGHGAGGKENKGERQQEEQPVLYDDGKTQYYRSKDAGKTCKERFSYSSFDAGATVLKTSSGAQNAKAILVENKDSYMLLECHKPNKFVIVELSDDILVDTIVLANFEFFSSMVRAFRVSVSDRYPVKLDKWLDLGTFEARNSRDIQAFLVEHPQIYTKYLRVEFLSHYGNEYYCPVSLLRVHGTRMLDSWKEPEEEPEALIEDEPQPEQQQEQEQWQQPDARLASSTGAPETQPSPQHKASASSSATFAMSSRRYEMGLSLWQPVFYDNITHMCPATSRIAGTLTTVSVEDGNLGDASDSQTSTEDSSAPAEHLGSNSSSEPLSSSSEFLSSSTAPQSDSRGSFAVNASPGFHVSGSSMKIAQGSQKGGFPSSPSSAISSPSPNLPNSQTATPPSRDKATHPSSISGPTPSPSPTVQESFFKTVHKRLQLLESNSSLSMQYIADQSRFLQDALRKLEKRQIGRVDDFLDTLNRTVLAELRTVRTQYDQVWQGTVLALETQRDQRDRDIAALTQRMELLANEVVFQKRIAIAQSVLLLSCLALLLFSRGGLNVVDLALASGGHAGAQRRRQLRRTGPAPRLSEGTDRDAERNGLATLPLPSSAGPLLAPKLKKHVDFQGDSLSLLQGSSATVGAVAAENGGLLRQRLHPALLASLRSSPSFDGRDKTLPLTPTSECSREGTPFDGTPNTDRLISPAPSIADSQLTAESETGRVNSARDMDNGAVGGNATLPPPALSCTTTASSLTIQPELSDSSDEKVLFYQGTTQYNSVNAQNASHASISNNLEPVLPSERKSLPPLPE